jgi:DNA-binding Lrp family transcriptional regulator
MSNIIDKPDRIILEQLQNNARVSIEVLADACGLSAASVQRRVKRLRDTHVIESEVAILNPKALGQGMTFIVMVELETERTDQLDAFRRIVKKDSQVQQCYYITGEADFTLICTAQNMEDFEALTQRLFFENKNIKRFKTSVVMDRTKVGLSIPTSEN